MVRRIVKKPEVRRGEIIAASRALFLSQGYDNTTMQDVMAKLHIAKGTTYHYFKSKEALLEAVIEEMVTECVSAVEKALDASTGNALDKMMVLINSGRMASSSTETLHSLHQAHNQQMHARLLAITVNRLAPLYARVISQGCEEGVFRVEHPLECAEVWLAGIQFITDVGCHPWSKEELKRRMKALPTLIESQLNAPKGSFSSLFKEEDTKD